jgi:hypothetical protein
MAYKLRQYGKIRDVCYPSVIAAERPALVTRLTWEDDRDANELASRGTEGEDRVARFNEQLRSGIGTGRGSGSDGDGE